MDRSSSGPLVSVGIPTYNGAKTITESLLSVLAQTHLNIEVLVSDNASTDATEDICRKFQGKDARIKYIRQFENVGAFENFLKVLNTSTGDYFMWLGDDDWIDEVYVEKCLKVLVQDQTVGLVAGNCVYYFEEDKSQQGESQSLESDDSLQRIYTYYENVLNNGAFYGVYRKSVLETVSFKKVFAGDWLLVDHVCRCTKIKVIDDVFIHRKFNKKETHEYLSELDRVSIFYRLCPYFFFSLKVFWDILVKKTFLKDKVWMSRVACSFKVVFILNSRFGKCDLSNLKWAIKKVVTICSTKISFYYKSFFFLTKSIAGLGLIFCCPIGRKTEDGYLAMFSPLPPVKSGISDYSEDLLRELKKYYNVDVFVDFNYQVVPKGRKGCVVYNYLLFRCLNYFRNYRSVIYQVGNSPYHDYMYREIKRTGGIVVLHDGMNFPFRGDRTKLLEKAGVLVHNKPSLEDVRSSGMSEKVTEIPQLMPQIFDWKQLQLEKKRLRGLKGIPDEALVIGAFGIINPAKNIIYALSAVDELFSNDDDFLFIVAGHEIQDEKVAIFFDKHKDDRRYLLEIGLSIESFYESIIISDICFNLRYPFHGETSAALLKVMSCGVPSIVTDIGSFSHFPDYCVIKTSPEIVIEEYKDILSKAKVNKQWLHDIGKESYDYVKNNHEPEAVCRKYMEQIECDLTVIL